MNVISDKTLPENLDYVNTKSPESLEGTTEQEHVGPPVQDVEYILSLLQLTGDFPALLAPETEARVAIENKFEVDKCIDPHKPALEPLIDGFHRTDIGHIKAPNGILYKEPFIALAPAQQKVLQNTPFGRFGGTGSNFVDCHVEEPPAWNIQDLIHEGIIAVIAGAGSVGKSLLAEQMSLCCAGGISFLGKKCVEGKVLYINTEDPKNQNQRRIRRILNGICRQVAKEKADAGEKWTKSEESILRAKILDHLTFINMCDDPGWSCYSPELINEGGRPTEFYNILKAYCDVFQPVLVVLDPLIYFLANENDNIEAKRAYHLIKKLSGPKTSFLAPHHQNKSSLSADNRNATEAARQTNSRGAGHLVMGAKFVGILEKNDKIDDAYQLVVAKHNFCENPTANKIPTDIIVDHGYTDTGEPWMLWRLSGESLGAAVKPASTTSEPSLFKIFNAGLERCKTEGNEIKMEGRDIDGSPTFSQEQSKMVLEAGREILGLIDANHNGNNKESQVTFDEW